MNSTKKIQGITLGMAAMLLGAFITVAAIPKQTAEAALVSENIYTYTLKNEPTTVQMVGSGNYNDWHYVVKSQPTYGVVPSFDGVTGEAFYQPNAGVNGIADKFTYRLEKDNPDWFSNTSTVRIAIVENWTEFYPEKVTPVVLMQYIKDKGLTSATVNTTPGVSNIEPYKATPQGKIAYSNVKAAWELSGQSWWNLSLGQKQWLMDNLHNKAYVFYGLTE
jgi:hypothetical protein